MVKGGLPPELVDKVRGSQESDSIYKASIKKLASYCYRKNGKIRVKTSKLGKKEKGVKSKSFKESITLEDFSKAEILANLPTPGDGNTNAEIEVCDGNKRIIHTKDKGSFEEDIEYVLHTTHNAAVLRQQEYNTEKVEKVADGVWELRYQPSHRSPPELNSSMKIIYAWRAGDHRPFSMYKSADSIEKLDNDIYVIRWYSDPYMFTLTDNPPRNLQLTHGHNFYWRQNILDVFHLKTAGPRGETEYYRMQQGYRNVTSAVFTL